MTNQPITAEDLQFELHDRLRRSLKLSGLSNQDMAEYLGVRREAVSTWLTGKVHPKLGVRRLWALRTGVPFEWLETGQVPDHHDGGPGPGVELPRLDSNQQPSGYLSPQVRALLPFRPRPQLVELERRAA